MGSAAPSSIAGAGRAYTSDVVPKSACPRMRETVPRSSPDSIIKVVERRELPSAATLTGRGARPRTLGAIGSLQATAASLDGTLVAGKVRP